MKILVNVLLLMHSAMWNFCLLIVKVVFLFSLFLFRFYSFFIKKIKNKKFWFDELLHTAVIARHLFFLVYGFG